MPQSSHNQASDWREVRRRRGWVLHQQGWTQAQIAHALGVSQGAVSRWLKQVRDNGSIDALRTHPAPGKRARLTEAQFAQLPALIARGAEAFGFRGNHWTTKRVAVALQQMFGVTYHSGHVSRILQKYCPDWRNYR